MPPRLAPRCQVTVLDLRRTDEFAAARITGAVNIALHELPGRT
jgi:rhodanese-related sulfurtransferase